MQFLSNLASQVEKMQNKILSTYKVDKNPSIESVEVRWKCFSAKYPDGYRKSGVPPGAPGGHDPTELLTAFLFEKKVLDTNKADKEAVSLRRRVIPHRLPVSMNR